jgi:hypothetical protein
MRGDDRNAFRIDPGTPTQRLRASTPLVSVGGDSPQRTRSSEQSSWLSCDGASAGEASQREASKKRFAMSGKAIAGHRYVLLRR